jgi:hypothetical protein
VRILNGPLAEAAAAEQFIPLALQITQAPLEFVLWWQAASALLDQTGLQAYLDRDLVNAR